MDAPSDPNNSNDNIESGDNDQLLLERLQHLASDIIEYHLDTLTDYSEIGDSNSQTPIETAILQPSSVQGSSYLSALYNLGRQAEQIVQKLSRVSEGRNQILHLAHALDQAYQSYSGLVDGYRELADGYSELVDSLNVILDEKKALVAELELLKISMNDQNHSMDLRKTEHQDPRAQATALQDMRTEITAAHEQQQRQIGSQQHLCRGTVCPNCHCQPSFNTGGANADGEEMVFKMEE